MHFFGASWEVLLFYLKSSHISGSFEKYLLELQSVPNKKEIKQLNASFVSRYPVYFALIKMPMMYFIILTIY